jgi:hypothetical protein
LDTIARYPLIRLPHGVKWGKIDESRFQEEDLIGRVYEYFLQVYAASGTKEDGEFYTPACVVQLIAEMIEPYSGVVYEIIIPSLIQRNGIIKKYALAV